MNKENLRRQKRYLKSIQSAFLKAEKYFDMLDDQTQRALFDFHHEYGSVNHCIRRGLQAASEALKDWDGFAKGACGEN